MLLDKHIKIKTSKLASLHDFYFLNSNIGITYNFKQLKIHIKSTL